MYGSSDVSADGGDEVVWDAVIYDSANKSAVSVWAGSYV